MKTCRRRLSTLLPLLVLFVKTVRLSEGFLLTPRITRSWSFAAFPTVSKTALSGIRGFRAWFETQFPDAITTIDLDDYHNNNKSKKNARQTCDEFDHVLVDVNQLLHRCVRKSKSDGHALVLLIKELDSIVELANPKKSLVLATDGPPSAAKLATQRQRRYSSLSKNEWRLQNLPRMKLLRKQQVVRKRKKVATESRRMCLTPGTEFMARAQAAIVYWAWQRLDNQKSILSRNRVKIYSSPSVRTIKGCVPFDELAY
jgi:5'-3' exonuclease